MPAANDGGSAWNTTICTPLARDPAGLYEPCTVIGSGVSGVDTCGPHKMCWNVVDGVGECIGMCQGTQEAPHCEDPAALCMVGREGILNLCFPMCDPILQDCPNNDLCLVSPNEPNCFICVLDASGDEGQAFDPCEYANACDPGHLCADPKLAAECDPDQTGCCLPMCDTSLANTCPGAGQACVPWFEAGTAPPGFENVGLCGLPQ